MGASSQAWQVLDVLLCASFSASPTAVIPLAADHTSGPPSGGSFSPAPTHASAVLESGLAHTQRPLCTWTRSRRVSAYDSDRWTEDMTSTDLRGITHALKATQRPGSTAQGPALLVA